MTTTTRPALDRRLVLLLAVVSGTTVANLYYAQPLLDSIASGLGTGPGAAGLIVTAAQAGYAAGLVLLVPLGDLVERRRLIVRLLLVCALALGGRAAAPSLPVLALAVAVVGVTSVVAQVVVPLAGDLAADDERGRVVGTVMSGLLVGILAARTVAGLAGDLGGWRAIFVVAAVLMLALAVLLQRRLPSLAPRDRAAYLPLLRSVWTLVREEPVLRRRMVYGALGFATFTVLWTAMTFLLSRPPFGYGDAAIGLVGLVGVLGAVAARRAGVLADRGRGHVATGAFYLAILAGWGFCLAGETSIAPLLVGVAGLDVGVQGQHITNQSTIYGLRPEARSRLTTAYMTGNFVCGALASAGASLAWSLGGWPAVCALGGGLALLGVGCWVQETATR